MKKKQKEKVGYSLTSFAVLEYFSKLNENYKAADNVAFNVSMNYFIANDLSNILVRATLKMFLRLDDPLAEAPVLAQLGVQTIFNTTNLDHYLENGEVMPPKDFLEHIINVVISTSRGIFLAKNFGTGYANIVMPLIDTDLLIPKEPFRLDEKEK